MQIVLPVIFDGGLSISGLRNRQFFEENGRQKVKYDNKRHLKLHIKKIVFSIYRMMPRMLDFDERLTVTT
jgi:hypothetical protein